MGDTIKIPDGFRWLEPGEVIELTDMFLNDDNLWEFVGCACDLKPGERWNHNYLPLIRKK